MSEPTTADLVFQYGAEQIVLRSTLREAYRLKLAETAWLERVVEQLRSYPELAGKSLLVELQAKFPAPFPYAGPSYYFPDGSFEQTFLLKVSWVLPSPAPMDVTYDYEINYSKKPEQAFKLVERRVNYLWRAGDDLENLEQRLLECGILKEVVIDPGQPDRKLAETSMHGTLDRPEFVLVDRLQHVLRVAIDSPRTFPTDLAVWQKSNLIVEPVLVRDRQRLAEFRENLYRGLKVRKSTSFRGFGLAESSSLKPVESDELQRFRETIQAGDSYYVEYFSAWGRGRVKVWVSRSTVAVEGGERDLHGALSAEVWDALEELARDEQIWQPEVEDQGAINGLSWTLKRTGPNPRRISLGCPDACRLIDFCLELMRLVGLEVLVERRVSWRPEKVRKGSRANR